MKVKVARRVAVGITGRMIDSVGDAACEGIVLAVGVVVRVGLGVDVMMEVIVSAGVGVWVVIGVVVRVALGVNIGTSVAVVVGVNVTEGLIIGVMVLVAVCVLDGTGESVRASGGVFVVKRAITVSSSVAETATVGVWGASIGTLQPANSNTNVIIQGNHLKRMYLL